MTPQEYSEYVLRNWGRKRANDGRPPVTPAESLCIMSTGLAGEVGETLEHVKKFVRDGKMPDREFLLECGDALHYLVRLLGEFGYSLQDAIDGNVDKLDARFGHRL
jgi:NTP pyrophosphatase (non-canonical NTP hydrolase)